MYFEGYDSYTPGQTNVGPWNFTNSDACLSGQVLAVGTAYSAPNVYQVAGLTCPTTGTTANANMTMQIQTSANTIESTFFFRAPSPPSSGTVYVSVYLTQNPTASSANILQNEYAYVGNGSAASTVVTDTGTPGWTVNQWVTTGPAPLSYVFVTSGTYAGDKGVISSNTGNTITLSSWSSGTPTGYFIYRIQSQVNPIVPTTDNTDWFNFTAALPSGPSINVVIGTYYFTIQTTITVASGHSTFVNYYDSLSITGANELVPGANLILEDAVSGSLFDIGNYSGSYVRVNWAHTANGGPANTSTITNISNPQINVNPPVTLGTIQASHLLTVWVGSNYGRTLIPPGSGSAPIYMYLDTVVLPYTVQVQDLGTGHTHPGNEIYIYSGSTVITSGYLGTDLSWPVYLRPDTYTVVLKYNTTSTTGFCDNTDCDWQTYYTGQINAPNTAGSTITVQLSSQDFSSAHSQYTDVSFSLGWGGPASSTNHTSLTVNYMDISNSSYQTLYQLYQTNATIGTNTQIGSTLVYNAPLSQVPLGAGATGSGTASGFVVTDSGSPGWASGKWLSADFKYYLYVTSGSFAGYHGIIVGNTANTVTVNNWSDAPNPGTGGSLSAPTGSFTYTINELCSSTTPASCATTPTSVIQFVLPNEGAYANQYSVLVYFSDKYGVNMTIGPQPVSANYLPNPGQGPNSGDLGLGSVIPTPPGGCAPNQSPPGCIQYNPWFEMIAVSILLVLGGAFTVYHRNEGFVVESILLTLFAVVSWLPIPWEIGGAMIVLSMVTWFLR
jgi:hypothetical protein